MRSRRHLPVRPAPRSAFSGYRFPPEVITLAVRWYLLFGLSYRDVEELLAERGVEVDHVSVYRWVQRFAPEFAEAARSRQHIIGDRWHVDETYLKVDGSWRYLFRPSRTSSSPTSVLESISVFRSRPDSAGTGSMFLTPGERDLARGPELAHTAVWGCSS